VIENFWANAAYSLIPTILLGLIFWLVMRSIFRADRTERTVYAEIEAEERARFASENTAPQNAAPENAAAENTAAENVAVAASTAAASREPSA
jgi:hypothetical protein